MNGSPEQFEWRRGRTIAMHEFTFRADTSGGPGGQHANRSSTRITLIWRPSESEAFSEAEKTRLLEAFETRLTRTGNLRVRSSGERSAKRNKEECLDTLARLIRSALARRKKRVATKPSRASKERRLTTKRKRAQVKSNRRRPTRDD